MLPDVRGLHPFFEELALRLAGAGVHATAIDYFARTAETPGRGEGSTAGPTSRTRPDQPPRGLAAAAAHLRSPEGGVAARLYSVGFCFGGRLSLLMGA